MRLRRSDPHEPGYSRRRRGNGFSYQDRAGRPLTDPGELDRIRSLAIPPAWRDVWICPAPNGHIQAVGTDAAGRRQYLYHAQWRRKRDRDKFDHVLTVAARLPRLRRRVATDLRGPGLTRRRVLAAAARMIDLGLFRVGSDEYAEGEDATYGLATLLAGHARPDGGVVRFRFPGKANKRREIEIADRQIADLIRELRRHRSPDERLLAYRHGGAWHEIHRTDVNTYLRDASGCDITAKDFRTWHATVRAAVALAAVPPERTRSASSRRRAVSAVMRSVAADLGNTPAVARASYVDPRVVDMFLHHGTVVRLPARTGSASARERAVLGLLTGS